MLQELNKQQQQQKQQKQQQQPQVSSATQKPPLPTPPLKEWTLARALPAWHRRGDREAVHAYLGRTPGIRPLGGMDATTLAECMVRCDPATDKTNGFFVALFERRK